MSEKIKHPIDPVYDKKSKILILGSFPSVRSRFEGFFYGHPQNRFWRVLSSVFECPLPFGIDEKKHFLLLHQIALWDVIGACNIIGSADNTVKDAEPNDLSIILSAADIKAIFLNGDTAYRLFLRFDKAVVPKNIIVTKLPSTSPANAAFSQERLTKAWSVVKSI